MDKTHILSVVFVDDEMPIREELRLFDWESCHAVLVGSAANGEEAFDLCSEFEPDLLIADITMPLMNGLDLMRAVKKRFPKTQVALLTCHQDFGYIHRALQEGAIDYILKMTMTDDDIRRVVEKARSCLLKDRMAESQQMDSRRMKISGWINDILSGRKGGEDDGSRFPLSFPFRFARICLSVQYKDWIFVDREIQRCLSEQPVEWIPCTTGEYVLFFDGGSREEVADCVRRTLERLRRAVADRLLYLRSVVDMYALVSDSIPDRAAFVEAWNSLERWKKNRFYETGTDIFTGAAASPQALPANQSARMLAALSRKATSEAETLRFFHGDFCDWARRSRFDPEELKNFTLSLLGKTAQLLNPGSDERLPSRRVLGCDNMGQLLDVADSFVSRLSGRDSGCSVQIRAARKLIEQNLKEPLTLQTVSRKVGLSANYFSRVFAEQTGDTFNEYVTRRRMEEALRLLRETDCKIYEVAERVGIPSYRYFSSLFKNWTGLTPREYRKRC